MAAMAEVRRCSQKGEEEAGSGCASSASSSSCGEGKGPWRELSPSEIFALADLVREAVQSATKGLTCSAGVAASRILAKVCSDVNKPNGQFVLPLLSHDAFLNALPIRKIPGIGPHRQLQLETLGIKTCADLRSRAFLVLELFPDKTGVALLRLSFGLDGETRAHTFPKSLGSEETFPPTNERSKLAAMLSGICDSVSRHLREASVEAGSVVLKVKFSDFSVRSVSARLAAPTTQPRILHSVACSLLRGVLQSKAVQQARKKELGEGMKTEGCAEVRLLGVRCSALRPKKETGSEGPVDKLPDLARFFEPKTKVTPASPPSDQQSRVVAAAGSERFKQGVVEHNETRRFAKKMPSRSEGKTQLTLRDFFASGGEGKSKNPTEKTPLPEGKRRRAVETEPTRSLSSPSAAVQVVVLSSDEES